MNTLSIWNPIRDWQNIQNRLARPFGSTISALDEDFSFSSDWLPLVDVAEDDKEYTLTADLPDVKREDLHVRLQNGSISLSGERHREMEEKKRTYHRIERAYGKFERTFTLPEDATPEGIKAEFKGGILKVHLPKSKETPPEKKEITIS